MYNAVPDKGEVNTLPSLTKPNQSLTVLQILDRHSRGIPVNVSSGMPVYYGENFEMPVWEKLDMQERLDFIARFKDDLRGAKQRYVTEQEDKRKRDKEAFQASLRQQLTKLDNEKGAAGATGSAGEGQ